MVCIQCIHKTVDIEEKAKKSQVWQKKVLSIVAMVAADAKFIGTPPFVPGR